MLSAPTFTRWVLLRSAPFEALADFALADGARNDRNLVCWPARARTLLAFVRHVREVHRDDPDAPSERLVREAFVAFERAVADGLCIPSRLFGPKVEQRRVTACYTVAPATDARIRELQMQFGGSRGAIIDRLVAGDARSR